MPRTAAKVDANQSRIVSALRKVGASVQPLHAVGKGCPDLLVGWRGCNFLIEVKDGEKVASKQKLNADQCAWHGSWAGQVAVARSEDEALAVLAAFVVSL